MTARLRIAMMIGSMREGGAEGQLVELACGLRARGHDVRVFLLHPVGARLDRLLAEHVPVVGIALPRLRPLWKPASKLAAARALWRTVRMLRAFRPHVLHAWLFEAETWAALAKLCGAPGMFVTSRRSLGIYKDEAPWKQAVQNLTNVMARRVIANSGAVARDARRRERFLPPVSVIHNGVPLGRFDAASPLDLRSEFPALRDARRIVVMVANLFEYKGHFDAVAAWPRVLELAPGTALLCVGRDDGIGAELRRRIEAARLGEAVVLAGPRQDVPGILKGADAVLLASHQEGFPNAVLEAMACGRAVVATRVGGVPEMVEDGVTGLLVPPRDPAALARGVASLVDDDNRLRAFGAAGRRRAEERFGLARFLSRHEALYRALGRGSAR